MKVTSLSKKKAPTGESIPRGRPRKQIMIKVTIVPESKGKVVEVAMSMNISSSKITEPTLYNKAVNDPIYVWCWSKAIKNKLQNLENHQT